MHTSLSDVLRCLTSEASDFLIDSLREDPISRFEAERMTFLAASRLSCRALRDCIDSNANRLRITVRPDDQRRWEAGQAPPPLSRWPRCKHVTLVVPGSCSMGEDAPARLLLLLFAEQAAAERRLESLALHAQWYGDAEAANGESLVCMLVQRLPDLRSLNVELHGCMSYDPLMQQTMYHALAALPNLEHLKLPGQRSLGHVGTLAASTSLRRLAILDDGGDTLSVAACSGLSRLQWLVELELPYCALGAAGSGGQAPTGLFALLEMGFPPSLRQLSVQTVLGFCDRQVGFELSNGRFSRVSSCELQLYDLAALAELLLSCPAMGPVLQRLEIGSIHLFNSGTGTLHQAQAAQVRELLQRCVQVQIGQLEFTTGSTPAEDPDPRPALELLPLLQPANVRFSFRFSCSDTDLSLPYRGLPVRASGSTAANTNSTAASGSRSDSSLLRGSAAPSATHDGQGAPSQRPAQPSPAPADLIRAALHSMAGGGAPSQEPAAGSIQQGGGAGGAGDLSGACLLLLRVHSERAIGRWMRRLQAKADAAAAAGSSGSGGNPVLLSYQALPASLGVLLSCASAAAAESVEAEVVRRTNRRAAAAGSAGPEGARGMVEVVRLQSAECSTAKALFQALVPVMTDFWEGSAHGGDRCTLHERLQCVLALRSQLGRMQERRA